MVSMFLVNSLTATGGSERKTVRIVNELNKRGRPVHLAYLNSPDTLRNEIDGSVPVIGLDRKGKIDICIYNKLKEYVTKNEIKNILCINLYPLMYGILVKNLSFGKKIKCIALINKTDFISARKELEMFFYRPLLRNASEIVFGCKKQQFKWINRYKLNARNCSFIYNGVDNSFFTPSTFEKERSSLRKHFGFHPEDIVVVNVGSFRPVKRQEDLIEACAKLAVMGIPVRLALVGDGPQKSFLIDKVKDFGMFERVHFMGQILDVRQVLCASDIFVMSSSSETFSNAALEAMAMGKAVVLSDVGGASEMVVEGKSGYLYRSLDVESLVNKLKMIIEVPGKIEQLGSTAKKVVEEKFKFDTMISNYEKLLNSAVN